MQIHIYTVKYTLLAVPYNGRLRVTYFSNFLDLSLVQYLHGTAKEQINITTQTRIWKHFQNNDTKGVNFQLKK